jgi:hypothetical protein
LRGAAGLFGSRQLGLKGSRAIAENARVSRLPYSALAVALVLCACGPAVPEYRLVTSASGRQLKLEDVSEVVRAGETAMLLAYRSDVDFSDPSALYAEIDDVWRTFRPQVEQSGLGLAVIRASQWEKPGWERRGRAVQYVVERSSDGSWRARPDDEAVGGAF